MMKKKLMLGAALCATMMFGGLTSMAQDNAATTCDKAKCTRTCDKPADCQKPCPFEGLNLTDAQKAQLDQLRQDRQKARQERKQAKTDDKKKKAEGRVAARREQLAKIKAILTPEQYVTYLENVAVQGKQFKGQKAAKAGKGQKAGKGPRAARAQRPQGAPAQQN